MRSRSIAAAFLWTHLALAQTGSAPPQGFTAHDVAAEYRLPPMRDLAKETSSLQVMVRARMLHLHSRSATEAWSGAVGTYQRAEAAVKADPGSAGATAFRGRLASELNALLQSGVKDVRVASAEVIADVPIRITGTDVRLDLDEARVHGGAAPFLIRIENTSGTRLRGGVLDHGNWGVLIAGSHHVALTGMQIAGLSGGGVSVTNSAAVVIRGNRFGGLGAAPVMLHGKTLQCSILENEITDNLGPSNWNAGIVITDRKADVAANPLLLLRDDHYGVQVQRIPTRLNVPHDNVVAYNHIAANHSSGIYSDGGVRNVVVGNRIEGNSKEGLCLDNGSAANVVTGNLVRANGKRWGMSEVDLRRDFVSAKGRLADGTSPAKVPGISIDNAAFNQVIDNQVEGNFGGGIKMVRTALHNVVGLNTLINNNEGRSAKAHFFGVELGAARLDIAVKDLDAAPSRGNVLFGNTIRGTHYAGVFFGDGSDANNVFDNAIFGATEWAMESVKRQANTTLNNLTNLRLRNVGSGLDPALLKLGAGQFDSSPAR